MSATTTTRPARHAAATLTRMDTGRSRHEPEVYTAGRYGAWANCSCGWTSPRQRAAGDAALAWALHLRATQRRNGNTP